MSTNKERLPTQGSLTGRRLYLRPVVAEDIRKLHNWTVLTELQSQTCRPAAFRSVEEEVEAFKNRKTSELKQSFVVCTKADDSVVGLTTFFDMNTLNRSCELGLMIDPEQHRKGYGAEGLQILISYLFSFRDLHKVHAQTGGFNRSTIALLEKLGFSRDGELRDHYFWDGAFYPGYVYSLLQSEVNW